MHVYLLCLYIRTLGMLMSTHTYIFRTFGIPPVISYKTKFVPNTKRRKKKKKITTASSFSATKFNLQPDFKHISLLNVNMYKNHFLEIKVLSSSCNSSQSNSCLWFCKEEEFANGHSTLMGDTTPAVHLIHCLTSAKLCLLCVPIKNASLAQRTSP